MNRRFATFFLISLLTGTKLVACGNAAWAEDGEGSGGDGGSGGSGSGGSGSGGGNDDGGNDDGGNDDDGGGEDSGSGSSGSSSGSHSESDNIKEAVEHGKAVSLGRLMKFVNANYDGKVINVELKRQGNSYSYKVKLLTTDNKLKILTLNALTLAPADSAALY